MAPLNNGHGAEGGERAVSVKESRVKSRRAGPVRWTLGLIVRLCIWYALLTPFFQCPSRLSYLTESSPRVCKPYLYTRSYIEPYVLPYYDTYAAPYVETARPYVRVVNERIYVPASNIAKHSYDKYGAPALDHVQAYGQQQWTVRVVPHIQFAKDRASGWYEGQVAPHVAKVTTTVSPYYHRAHGTFRATLQDYVLPFCAKYQPFIGKTYSSGQEILTTRVMPYAQNTWTSALYIVNNSLWPKISSLYSENVEPQLVKIGQRLASYREGKRLRQVVDDADGTSSDSFTSSMSSQMESSKSESFTSSSIVKTTPTPTLSPAELAAQKRERISSDIETWQRRFAAAAQQGVEGLEKRTQEIVASYLASGVRTDGETLIAALETAVGDQTSAVKRKISTLTESLPFEEAPEKEETAINELLKEVRNVAVSLRERAHALREWRGSFEQELVHRVTTAVNSTLAILDDVRDLGLQEIGMRWAWMDGVTYQDWEDYHALKAQFEDWKEEFRYIGLHHAKIEEAKSITDDLLSHGMDIAEAAAKELSRLREVGKWKIAAREVSEDFDTRSEPPPPLPKPAQVPLEEAREDAEESMSGPPVSPAEEESEVRSPDASKAAFSNLGDEEPVGHVLDETEESSQPLKEDGQKASTGSEATTKVEDKAAKDSWGAAAAQIPLDHDAVDTDVDREEYLHQEAETPAQKPTQQKAVQDLLSELLAGKEASYEDILQRLNAIYETAVRTDTGESPLTVSSTESAESTAIPTAEAVLESIDEQLQSAVDAILEDEYVFIDQDVIEELSPTGTGIVSETSAPILSEDAEHETVVEGAVPEFAEEGVEASESSTSSTSTFTSATTETVPLEQVTSSDPTEDELPQEDL